MIGEYSSGACDAILDTAKSVYQDEIDRFKQAESKTSITIAFIAVIYAAFISHAVDFNIKKGNLYFNSLIWIVHISIFILMSMSIIFFLLSLFIGKYEQINLKDIVTHDFASESSNEVKLQISATYEKAINHNRNIIDGKLKKYMTGAYLMSTSFCLLSIDFITEEVIKLAEA